MSGTANNALLQISGLIGLGLPVLVSILKQDGLSRRANSCINVAICIVVALITTAARGELDWSNLLGAFTVLFIAGAAAYHTFFGPTGFDALISQATSVLKGENKPAATVAVGGNPADGSGGTVVTAPPGA